MYIVHVNMYMYYRFGFLSPRLSMLYKWNDVYIVTWVGYVDTCLGFGYFEYFRCVKPTSK